jgi:hypothetical protein
MLRGAAVGLWRSALQHVELPSRYGDHSAVKPANLAEVESIEPGLSPVFADPADLALDVQTPSGEVPSVDDPMPIRKFPEGLGDEHALTLMRSV